MCFSLMIFVFSTFSSILKPADGNIYFLSVLLLLTHFLCPWLLQISVSPSSSACGAGTLVVYVFSWPYNSLNCNLGLQYVCGCINTECHRDTTERSSTRARLTELYPMEHLVFVCLMDEPWLRDKLFKGIAKSVAAVFPEKKRENMKEFEK